MAWQTDATVTSKRTLGRVEKIGVLPPAFPVALLQLAAGSNGVRVCSFLGVSDTVRECVVKHFRLLADQVRVPRGKFEEEVTQFKGARQWVRETCGGKRQGDAGIREKERRLRDAATPHGERANGLLEHMHTPWTEAKRRQLLKAPLPEMPPSTLPTIWTWEVTREGKRPTWSCCCGAQKGGWKFMTWLAPRPRSHAAINCGKAGWWSPSTPAARTATKRIVYI